MKTFIVSLLALILLISCDPNADKKIGRSNFPSTSNGNNGGDVGPGGGNGSGGGLGTGNGAGTTDAPIDGGLSVLLIAGAAYGARKIARKKVRNKVSKEASKSN